MVPLKDTISLLVLEGVGVEAVRGPGNPWLCPSVVVKKKEAYDQWSGTRGLGGQRGLSGVWGATDAVDLDLPRPRDVRFYSGGRGSGPVFEPG